MLINTLETALEENLIGDPEIEGGIREFISNPIQNQDFTTQEDIKRANDIINIVFAICAQ